MLLYDLIANFRALMNRDEAIGDYVKFVADLTFYDNYFILAVSG